jgi:hypothetical protein
MELQTEIVRQKLKEYTKTDREIYTELEIPEQTYYNYKRKVMEQDAELWDKLNKDTAMARAQELIELLDFTKIECMKINIDKSNSAKDRMDALKTACEAQANIVKLINQGPTFRLSIPMNTLVANGNGNDSTK